MTPFCELIPMKGTAKGRPYTFPQCKIYITDQWGKRWLIGYVPTRGVRSLLLIGDVEDWAIELAQKTVHTAFGWWPSVAMPPRAKLLKESEAYESEIYGPDGKPWRVSSA